MPILSDWQEGDAIRAAAVADILAECGSAAPATRPPARAPYVNVLGRALPVTTPAQVVRALAVAMQELTASSGACTADQLQALGFRADEIARYADPARGRARLIVKSGPAFRARATAQRALRLRPVTP